MSKAYTEYITEHRENVKKAYDWLKSHKIIKGNFEKQIMQHDASKYSDEEYDAYDDYFYTKNKLDKFNTYAKKQRIDEAFNYAWLHHIHENPHHWQYWVLKHDDEPEEALEMPYEYVIEMICDWWSFSFKIDKLDEIFSWYNQHKGMVLHANTRKLVEEILENIKNELDKEEA